VTSPAPAEPAPASPRWPLAAWLAIAAIQILLIFSARAGETDSGETPFYEATFAITSAIVYGLLIALTFWIGSGYGNARKALGLVRFELRWLGYAALVVLGATVLAAILEPLLHAGEEQGFAPDEWRSDRAAIFTLNALVAVTLVPFAEELFFRGAGVTVLRPFGAVAAVAGTAVVFGLAHGIVVALPTLVPLAAGLAWVRLRSESLWPSVLAHAAYNGVAVIVLFVSLQ
jgi:membrane protease YdiL (CAAX protease family)